MGIGKSKAFVYDGFSLFPILNRELSVGAFTVPGAERALAARLSVTPHTRRHRQRHRDPAPSSNGGESQMFTTVVIPHKNRCRIH